MKFLTFKPLLGTVDTLIFRVAQPILEAKLAFQGGVMLGSFIGAVIDEDY